MNKEELAKDIHEIEMYISDDICEGNRCKTCLYDRYNKPDNVFNCQDYIRAKYLIEKGYIKSLDK